MNGDARAMDTFDATEQGFALIPRRKEVMKPTLTPRNIGEDGGLCYVAIKVFTDIPTKLGHLLKL